MKNKILLSSSLLFYFLVPCISYSQNIKNLDKNNGFKNFILGSKYTSLYGVKAKDKSGADRVVVSYTQEKIGDIPVKTIELYYLNDALAGIVVWVSPENHAKLLEACKSGFGIPAKDISENKITEEKTGITIPGNNYKDIYIWNGKTINLEYFYNYPKISGGANQVKQLYLHYSVSNYGEKLKTVKKEKYSTNDF